MTPTGELTPDVVEALLVDTSPYLSCDECFIRVDEYVERSLADADHRDEPLEAHLAGCGVCADEAEALKELLTNHVADSAER